MDKAPVSLILNPCPAAGAGVHRWIYYAACSTVEAGQTDEDAIPVIEDLITREPNPANEIEAALSAARGERTASSIRWPQPNVDKIEVVVRNGQSLRDLYDRSPIAVTMGESRTEEFIDALFPGNPLLCVGGSQHFRTALRANLRGRLSNLSLIVPSPMLRTSGRTLKGSLSAHALDNTGPRRYLVVEFDQGTLNQHSAVLLYLSEYAPLALVVFSGNRSLQGWFFCAGKPDEELEPFMKHAVSLGADRATWTRSQFVRLPDGCRRDGKKSDALKACGLPNVPPGRQAVLYFDPEATQ
jgi:hypothetical protein